MRDEEMLILVMILGVFGLPAIWIVTHYAYLAWKQWQATSLVRDMMNRGYTAQEIMQMFEVLGHREQRHTKPITDVPPAKPIRQPAYSP
jgi:LPS O-antigen subunit length determinant protein (WzzB/FepE family)